MNLMPQSIEEYVSEDNPVRAYNAFVEALDFQMLGIDINPDKVGNSEYDPLSMFKPFRTSTTGNSLPGRLIRPMTFWESPVRRPVQMRDMRTPMNWRRLTVKV